MYHVSRKAEADILSNIIGECLMLMPHESSIIYLLMGVLQNGRKEKSKCLMSTDALVIEKFSLNIILYNIMFAVEKYYNKQNFMALLSSKET